MMCFYFCCACDCVCVVSMLCVVRECCVVRCVYGVCA